MARDLLGLLRDIAEAGTNVKSTAEKAFLLAPAARAE